MNRVRLARRMAVLLIVSAVATPASRASQEEGSIDWGKLETQFKQAAAAKDARSLQVLTRQIANEDSQRAATLLIEYALQGIDPQLELEAGRALAAMRDVGARTVIYEQAIRSKNYKTRIILLGVAYYHYSHKIDEVSSFQVLANALLDRQNEVVFTALRWIKKTRDERAVEPLIAALAKWERLQRGRIYHDIRGALKAITAQEFQIADDWKNFWEARKAGAPPPPPKKGGRTEVVQNTFFSIVLDSDRLVFVIDVSGSMEKKDPPIEKENEDVADAGRRPRTRVGAPKKEEKKEVDPATLPLTRERLYRVKQELIRTVERLEERVHFTIQAYSNEIAFMNDSPALVPATPANKSKAVTWVRQLRPQGETWTDTALERVFNESTGVDTVILLSDGQPYRDGEPIPQEEVFAKIRETNRFAKCRIHTIGFKQAGSNLRKFLQRLAAEHDGTFTQLE